MKKIVYSCLIALSTFTQSFAADSFEKRYVINPEENKCSVVFNGLVEVPKVNNISLDFEMMKPFQDIFENWLNSAESPGYVKEFNPDNFFYQFVYNPQKNDELAGLIVIIPDHLIKNEFYTKLGAGLEIPGDRCLESYCAWLNDGEIFSCVVDKNKEEVLEFKNWRFKNIDEKFNPFLEYYSQLKFNYACKEDILNDLKIFHFVDNQMRDEVLIGSKYPVQLPKGRISTFVFYFKGRIKGVYVFDMTQIRKGCPMNFETTIYLKEKLGYERIIYAQPKCEASYPLDLLEKADLELITGLDWDDLTETATAISSR